MEQRKAKKKDKKKREENESPKEFEEYLKKKIPRQLILNQTEVLGRHYLSKNELKPGDLVFSYPAAVITMDKEAKKCNNCHKEGHSFCSVCNYVCYCSRDCQVSDWRLHKEECKVLKETHDIRKIVRLVIRVLAFISEEDSKEFRQTLDLLCFKNSDLSETEKKEVDLVQMKTLFKDYLKIEKLFRILMTNSFSIFGVNSNSTEGLAFVPLASFFNHSCDPNCSWSWNGSRLNIHATKKISPNSELHICYVDLLRPREFRRKWLLEKYEFVCQCSRCSEPWKDSLDRKIVGFYCSESNCKGIVDSSDPICNICGKQTRSKSDMESFFNNIEFLFQQARTTLKATFTSKQAPKQEELNMILELFRVILWYGTDVLYKDHYINFDVWRNTWGFTKDNQTIEKMVEWMDKYYPIEKEQAFELASLANSLLSQGPECLELAMKVTQRAMTIGSIALGDSHPLAQKFSQILSKESSEPSTKSAENRVEEEKTEPNNKNPKKSNRKGKKKQKH